MTLQACAELVERGDPVRFLAAMSCPPPAREVLFPLYAFNVEVSRAPYLTQEPMIAEMRLQWWRDALEEIGAGKPPRAHEVAQPLSEVIRSAGLSVALLDSVPVARRWDVWAEPFEDEAAFRDHLERVAGDLAWASALALGARPEDEAGVRDGAWAAGLARWFEAVPEMEARGLKPLADGRPEAVAGLAREGLERLARARRAVRGGPAALALRHGWETGPVLQAAAREPARVGAGQLVRSEFRRKLALSVVAARGRW
ncbi:squalene/phytoene synthase family protein [Histidinibacterium aquaticum]|uniref:Phytoene synthase n=1 Tax=Histidinibacterium aquaticum TaxID=2613962 RepID=A0A5J5GMU4_9RHOB|nr:squalene/phytoene synthase family protein [Histidinibacterium aquaticum]KAA9008928.1 phytoene synthase [Histidinibacterium aquaticum]